MTFRHKVLLLCTLCIFYLFFLTLSQLQANKSDLFSEENDNLVNFEPPQSWQLDPESEITPDPLTTPSTLLPSASPALPIIDPDEKYITFFTHSGFQNQLIQVENGILLAWYLNRTLILPKALLGEPFGWSPFDKLHLEHMIRDRSTSTNCDEYTIEIQQWNISCPNRERYALLPFDEIFDLSWAKQNVKIILRDQSDLNWLETQFGIQRGGEESRPSGSYVDGDILFFKGETRYDWRIFDTPRKAHRLGKYAASLDIYQLRERSEKLIHFSSLFGTGKLPIRRPEHYEFLRTLQRSITYRHPAVLQLAEELVRRLGGAGNFMGLHIRSGDGWFVKALPENINSTVSQINRVVAPTDQWPLTSKVTAGFALSLEQCLELAKTNNITLIYMATDARAPRSTPAFDPLWANNPCTFTIDDLMGPDDEAWMALDKEKHELSGKSMRKFLVPLVDATVASRGWLFIGSKGSTFSGYIHRLHDVFWSNQKMQTIESNDG
ncbi:uncharacterized protein BYT42DRAFT_582996 [Radiomyces spectabilis]|uniref:uncharacterized protein n=1 Tax=Radiomyces spectabilis TaxID=64574 RepID=UPI00221EA7FD|nr:uncharacterized protein BYT42DRAFT_582996 [Radiomyces spectabilis]KAI8370603.1 hypothetical protein BYT42DRAFT_582996 [Radiomyces spectabilis]